MSTINTPMRIVTFEVAEVNQIEVEDLEVGEDMNAANFARMQMPQRSYF